jgi:hypothetical protein
VVAVSSLVVTSAASRDRLTDKFFTKHWNLPWLFGEYFRTTVRLNSNAQRVPPHGLPSEYSQKAVFLKNVVPDAARYLPSESSVLESLIFAVDPIKNQDQTLVAFIAVGAGWLGYVEDVNSEKESDAVIMAMCGL